MNESGYEVIIIGGSQAGLALGYFLQQQRRHFLILDAGPAVGHTWRTRWDSLTLFTPCPYNNLPGLPFPKPAGSFPTKDEVANYLQSYVVAFDLPLALSQRVQLLERADGGFVVQTDKARFHGKQVVIATGPFQTPLVPAWSADLPAHVVQIHSSEYRNPRQVPQGPVLVVGAGNSGVQIAKELSHAHTVTLAAGRRLHHVPEQIARRLWFWQLYLGAAVHLKVDSPLGPLLKQQDILFGNSLADLQRKHGVKVVGRAQRVANGQVYADNGQAVAASTVIWATGFRPDYHWVNLPVCDSKGRPQQHDGLASVPGVYFLGLFWQSWSGSAMLGGVGRDARELAQHIASLSRSTTE